MSTPADVAFCFVPPLPTSRVTSRSCEPTRTPSQNAWTPRSEHTASRNSSRSAGVGTCPSACATPPSKRTRTEAATARSRSSWASIPATTSSSQRSRSARCLGFGVGTRSRGTGRSRSGRPEGRRRAPGGQRGRVHMLDRALAVSFAECPPVPVSTSPSSASSSPSTSPMRRPPPSCPPRSTDCSRRPSPAGRPSSSSTARRYRSSRTCPPTSACATCATSAIAAWVPPSTPASRRPRPASSPTCRPTTSSHRSTSPPWPGPWTPAATWRSRSRGCAAPTTGTPTARIEGRPLQLVR